MDTRVEDQVHPSEGTFPGGGSYSAIWQTVGMKSSAVHGVQQSSGGHPEKGLEQRSTPYAHHQDDCVPCMPFPVFVDSRRYTGGK